MPNYMMIPNPEKYTITKTVPFHQSREVSLFIWKLSLECRHDKTNHGNAKPIPAQSENIGIV